MTDARERPYLWITPARQGGEVCIGGTRVPARHLADLVFGGYSLDEVASDYAVTRDDVVLAVWWFSGEGALPDGRTRRGKWLKLAHRYLATMDANFYPGEWSFLGHTPNGGQ